MLGQLPPQGTPDPAQKKTSPPPLPLPTEEPHPALACRNERTLCPSLFSKMLLDHATLQATNPPRLINLALQALHSPY